LFVSLPTPRGVDAEGLMDGYLVALESLPLEALKTVVVHLIKGTWRTEVTFCPRPPELANMVRDEQRRVDAINRPRLPSLMAVSHQFVDLRITHRRRAESLAKDGYRLVAEGVTADSFRYLGKSRAIPSGSVHLFAIDEVWAPAVVAHQADLGRIETRKVVSQADHVETITDDPEYWKAISDLRDAPEITAEQQAFRRKIASSIPSQETDDEHEPVDDNASDWSPYEQADDDYQMAG
jgi:hypothetical protein